MTLIRRWRALLTVEVVAVAIAVIPVIAAVVRAIVEHWIPVGDDALDEIRSVDVFSTSHFPLLGTWSSASLQAGKDLNHPGPLLFDLLSIPVRLFGGPTGVALGCGIINALSVIGIAVVAHRLRGRVGLLAATMMSAALAWTLGSRMLVDPWNPHVLVLPCLLMLMLTWAVAAGAVSWLPLLFFVASLCLETHLSYAYLVPALCLIALAGCAIVYRQRWRADAACRATDTPILRRWGLIAIGVFVLAWAQPLWEQFTSSGQGNLTRLATSTGGDEPKIGARLAVRLLASIVAIPPGWSRSSFIKAVPFTQYNADGTTITPKGVPGIAISTFALVAVGTVLVVFGLVAWRSRRRPEFVAAVVTAIALAVAAATLAVEPIGVLGLTPHQMRWLWSIGAFLGFVIVLELCSLIGGHLADARLPRRGALSASFAVIAIFSAINIPGYVQLAGPSADQFAQASGRQLDRQLDRVLPLDSVMFDVTGLRFLDNYAAVVMAALQRNGVDFFVTDPGLIRQLGEARRFTGQAHLRMFLRDEHDALVFPAGDERIALASPLSREQIGTLTDGEQQMVDVISAVGLTLTPQGRSAVESGTYPGITVASIDDASIDAQQLVDTGAVATLVAAGALVLPDEDADLFRQTSALREQVTPSTVGVFIAALPTG